MKKRKLQLIELKDKLIELTYLINSNTKDIKDKNEVNLSNICSLIERKIEDTISRLKTDIHVGLSKMSTAISVHTSATFGKISNEVLEEKLDKTLKPYMVEMGNKLIDLTNLTNSKTTDIQEKFEENLSKISVNIDERFKEASNMLETYDLENIIKRDVYQLYFKFG
ncbi:hypothetical protein Avbf_01678 [Armadillidium vulgare]|nr:hypothetical protein Avbf_01678 [Armadillidium vulgare]